MTDDNSILSAMRAMHKSGALTMTSEEIARECGMQAKKCHRILNRMARAEKIIRVLNGLCYEFKVNDIVRVVDVAGKTNSKRDVATASELTITPGVRDYTLKLNVLADLEALLDTRVKRVIKSISRDITSLHNRIVEENR